VWSSNTSPGILVAAKLVARSIQSRSDVCAKSQTPVVRGASPKYATVGFSVGDALGPFVGLFDGLFVGVVVGYVVGACVSTAQ